jgi:tetratricopeptide (TPR) repeat protein
MSRLLVVSLALTAVGAAAGDKGPKPDQPLALHVFAKPAADAADKAGKERNDSVADVRKRVTGKHKEWFRLVESPEEAEVILEVVGRGYESGHAYVLEGRLAVLDILSDQKVIGQGGLGDQVFKIWTTAAADLTTRVQTFCQKVLPDLASSRSRGVRPLAVAAVERGDALFKKDDLDAALAEYDQALRVAPRYVRALFNRGLVRMGRKEYAAAATAFGETVAVDPGLASAHAWRAEACQAAGDSAQALASAEQALALDAKSALAYRVRGELRAARKENEPALADFAQAIALDPDARAYFGRGLLLADAGRHEEAIADFSAAIRLEPKHVAARLARGDSCAQLNRWQDAIDSYSAALGLDPSSTHAYLGRGFGHLELRGFAQAAADFSEAIKLDSDNARAYLGRSRAYAAQKKTRLAQEDRKKAASLDPKLAQGAGAK